MPNAIEAQHLTYRPGKGFLLNDLAITVPRGSVYGFLGPNGSGKTTTIKLLLGILQPQRGSIKVLDQPIPSKAHLALARIGYVPEAPHLYATLSVACTIEYHASFYPTWDQPEADRLLERFRLRAEQRVGSLSKGETRKLMVLLALSQRPELLVLDEPTDGLDPVIRRDLLDALASSVTQGTTVLISSHLVHELEGICDWVAVIDGGTLAAQMPMEKFRDDIKLLHLTSAPALEELPFEVLRTIMNGDDIQLVVRGWKDDMADIVRSTGGTLQRVEPVDLERAFVETLEFVRPEPGAQ